MFGKVMQFKISQKLMLSFLVIGVLPALVIGLLSLQQAGKGLENAAFNQLEAVSEIKKVQLQNYFSERERDMQLLVDISKTLRQQALEKLTAVREVKKHAVENYFANIFTQIKVLSADPVISEAVENLNRNAKSYLEHSALTEHDIAKQKAALKQNYMTNFLSHYQEQNPGKEPEYFSDNFEYLDPAAITVQHQLFLEDQDSNPIFARSYERWFKDADTTLRNYQQQYGYSNLYLISTEDNRVVYSTNQKIDFATDLMNGPYGGSNISYAYEVASQADKADFIYISDFVTYTPDYEQPAMFIASPIFAGNKAVGVMIVQLGLERLNQVMAERSGLGKTGETYLVGNDYLMRSDSLSDPKRSAVNSITDRENGRVTSLAISRALAGRTGNGVVKNYLGKPVLSSWVPVKINNFSWALLAEIDITEALSPIDNDGQAFYQTYATANGYKDLLLINPDGYIFFTAQQGKDNQTNILTGPYKDSHLGKLVEKVRKDQRFAFADFSPYPADSDRPASFMAIPLVNQDKVELIIATRLPLEGINAIMGIRRGMGESGESYLVGPDKRMRSDSYHDSHQRSVAASFSGDISNNGVDTVSVNAALQGESGTHLSQNYHNADVLSAYTPLLVGDQNWAMVSEVDTQEALAKSFQLRWLMAAVLGSAITLIVIVGFVLSRQISSPISRAAELAEKVSSGELNNQITVTSQDEIGHLQGVLKNMTGNLQSMVAQIRDSADQQTESSEQLAEVTEQTRHHIQLQNANTEQVAAAITELSATLQEVSSNTERASEAAGNAQQEVSEGSTQVRDTIKEIHNFATEIDTIAEALSRVQAGTESIGSIVDVINAIASQTNLLALNAAIEAARAGDQGRGFAVVADEVRSLAQSTQDSTKQIEDMIAELQLGSQASTDAMNRGKNQMEQVIALAENTGEALNRIHDSVDHINSMNQQIASATEQQTLATEDINRNIIEINELSGMTNQDADQVSRASQRLSVIASDLQRQVGQFKA